MYVFWRLLQDRYIVLISKAFCCLYFFPSKICINCDIQFYASLTYICNKLFLKETVTELLFPYFYLKYAFLVLYQREAIFQNPVNAELKFECHTNA